MQVLNMIRWVLLLGAFAGGYGFAGLDREPPPPPRFIEKTCPPPAPKKCITQADLAGVISAYQTEIYVCLVAKETLTKKSVEREQELNEVYRDLDHCQNSI